MARRFYDSVPHPRFPDETGSFFVASNGKIQGTIKSTSKCPGDEEATRVNRNDWRVMFRMEAQVVGVFDAMSTKDLLREVGASGIMKLTYIFRSDPTKSTR